MENQQITFVTLRKTEVSFGPRGFDDSEIQDLMAFLKEKGLQVSLQAWDDSQVDWTKAGLIIIKSPWDYSEKYEAFRAWLDKLEQLRCQVLNPLQAIRWNCDKIYLKGLQQDGVNIIPTVFLEQNSTFDMKGIFEKFGVDKIVVKPRVSCSSRNTRALSKEDDTAEAEINQLLQKKPLMIQPFMKEIQTKGEWGLLFFNGKFSHSVLKHPKEGCFLVHGYEHISDPPEHLVATAQDIVDRFAQGCLYARVDGLEVDGKFTLMELEVIEPFYFLDGSAKCKNQYYEALMSFLAN